MGRFAPWVCVCERFQAGFKPITILLIGSGVTHEIHLGFTNRIDKSIYLHTEQVKRVKTRWPPPLQRSRSGHDAAVWDREADSSAWHSSTLVYRSGPIRNVPTKYETGERKINHNSSTSKKMCIQILLLLLDPMFLIQSTDHTHQFNAKHLLWIIKVYPKC